MIYIFIFLGCLLFFFKTFSCGYCVDDNVMVKLLKKRKEEGYLNWIKKRGIKRFILEICYGAGFFNNAKQEHIFTTILHAVNSCLIYKATGSLIVTMLWMLSPVNNQIAIWLNGRRYALGITCVLIAWNFKLLFFPFYAFSVWMHVYTAAFPIVFALTQWWFYLPVGLFAVGIFGWKPIRNKYISRKKEFVEGNELQRIRPKKIVIYIKSLGFYFLHTLFPLKPRMYHEFLYYFSRYKNEIKKGYSLNWKFWFGLIVAAFIGYEIGWERNVWALWWLAFISQYCNVVTVTMNVADRYCSLSGIGLLMVASKYINMLPSPYSESIYVGLLTLYIIKYIPLFRAYNSAYDFHWYHIGLQPDGVEARCNLAELYIQAKDPYRAFAVIKDGLRYRPQDFKLIIMMAKSLFAMRQTKTAYKTLEYAKKFAPLGEEKDTEMFIEEIKRDHEKYMEEKRQENLKGMSRQRRRAMERKSKK